MIVFIIGNCNAFGSPYTNPGRYGQMAASVGCSEICRYIKILVKNKHFGAE